MFPLQPRIHRLALEREHSEDALVNTPERLAANEPLQPFDAERELAQREGSFGRQASLPQAIEVRRQGREKITST